jgi:hypothetical protein
LFLLFFSSQGWCSRIILLFISFRKVPKMELGYSCVLIYIYINIYNIIRFWKCEQSCASEPPHFGCIRQ